jgi:hypothetical protein
LNVPLIIAGYGSSALINALSVTLFNRIADKMLVDGKVPPNPVGNGKILAVYDAFGCIDKVLEVTKGKYVCFISQTSEELSIEPRSIYNYALPLFIEYFIKEDVIDSDEVLGCVLKGEVVEEKNVENKAKSLLPTYCLPRLAQNRVKKLLDTAQNLYGGIYNFNDIFMLQVIPIMLSLSLRGQLVELISQKYTSSTAILRLIGEPDEYIAD